jgi:SAM-dependent methyltransferase
MFDRLRFELRQLFSADSIWPPIDYELEGYRARGLLKGEVLNAGAGWRDIGKFVEGNLINQDITWPNDERKNIQIFSPIHKIPTDGARFDTIVCLAVLEHVENPEEIIPEFFRVLKPGGHVIASVPFLQPEHKVPTDYQRYTKDGLGRLFLHHGFEVLEVQPLFSVYHTLTWIVKEWLHLKDTVAYKLLRLIILPPLVLMGRRSKLTSDKLASAFQILARKPAAL